MKTILITIASMVLLTSCYKTDIKMLQLENGENEYHIKILESRIESLEGKVIDLNNQLRKSGHPYSYKILYK